jgi:hypothetical protein
VYPDRRRPCYANLVVPSWARIALAVAVVVLVGYAGWLIVGNDDAPEKVDVPKSAKTPRRDAPAGGDEAEKPARPKPGPARPRPSPSGGDTGGPDPANQPPEMAPETARQMLEVLVEDIEAKADRGESMSQAEWVQIYKRGNEMTQVLAKHADPKDTNAQKEFGDLNTRFRMGIAKVQPRPE